MGWVYLVTNLQNGRRYVGITMHDFRARWRSHVILARKGSKLVFHRAIRKYGEAAFTLRPIYIDSSWEALCRHEKYFIRALGTKAPQGYNLTDGGEGFSGLKQTKKHRANISAGKMGVTFSAEHILNLSLSHKGKPGRKWSNKSKRKASISAKAASNTPEQKKMRSDRAKRQHAEGKLGQDTWTEASKLSMGENISKSLLGRKFSKKRRAQQSVIAKGWYSKLTPEEKSVRGRRQALAFWGNATEDELRAREAKAKATRLKNKMKKRKTRKRT